MNSCPTQAGTSDHQRPSLAARRVLTAGLCHQKISSKNLALLYLRSHPFCREKNLGSDHLDTAASMLGLGCLLQQLGQLPEAEQLCRQCLEIREAQLGPQHAETAAALMGVGSVLLEQQQRAEAKLLLEKAVYLSILKLGEQHSQTRQARELLGRC